MLWAASAFADFSVYPTRIEMSDTKRVANVAIRHNDGKPGHYKVTVTFYRMKSDGAMEEVKEPQADERSLGKYLRFSPREVQLAPHSEQIVRVMFAGPGNLPEGDYRAHLHVVPIDPPDAGDGAQAKNDKTISLRLDARLAFAIPVVFHRGKASFTSKLENLRILKNGDSSPQAAVEMQWNGNAFPYGDFYAVYTAPGGKPEEVGFVRGIGSYASPRTVSIPLSSMKQSAKGGTLRVEFREVVEQGGKVVQAVEAALP